MRASTWIEARREGIYLPSCNAWVDPSQAVGTALVTHGHADHARGGHGITIATPETLAIMGLRYGVAQGARPVMLREAVMIGDNLEWEIVAPQRLGIYSIWMDAHGEGLPKDTPVKPDRIITSLDELLP